MTFLSLFFASMIFGGLALVLFPQWDVAWVWLAGTWMACLCVLFWQWRSHRQFMNWFRTASDRSEALSSQNWHEISERILRLKREHKQEIQASEDRIHRFFEAIQASPNGVVLLDEQGRIEWCNLMAAEHWHIDLQRDQLQLIGNLIRDPQFLKLIQSDASEPITLQTRGAALNSRRRISVQKFAYGAGRLLLLSTDVTQVELAESMRQQFVANVSHEIRTPLTVILSLIESLKTLPLTQDEKDRYLGKLQEHAARMDLLVTDLLTLSKLEGTPIPTPKDHFDLWAMLEEAVSMADALTQTQFAQHPHVITLDWALPSQANMFWGSRIEMLSAVTNLLNNAIRYSAPGTDIRLTTQTLLGDTFSINVIDQGVGIPPEHIPRLSERFYRVDSTRSRATGGTGLGLTIVKHIAQRHEGHLAITSQPGAGSSFSLCFPMSRLMNGTNE